MSANNALTFSCFGDDAKQFGSDAAIIMFHFRYWITENMVNGRARHDGKTWCYQSLKQLSVKFDFLSIPQIKRIMIKLVESGVMVKGNYNTNPFDQTVWYAFTNEAEYIEKRISDIAESTAIEQTEKTNSSHALDEIGNCTISEIGNSLYRYNKKEIIKNTPTGSEVTNVPSKRSTSKLSGEDQEAYNELWEAFLSHNDGHFANYAREGKALKTFIGMVKNVSPTNWRQHAFDMIETFYEARRLDPKFIGGFPLLPSSIGAHSVFTRIHDKVAEYKRQKADSATSMDWLKGDI